ncbi:hypothetical protein SAMN05444064_110193 [Pseudomonas syringae]|uniref:hypothetical protein n=1 Tax=Pseudomonas syringae TaxID=317 RepID=UPI000894A6A5|nr:hypothetical protein [Pseudomonas syringae]SDX04591.1 hypothetical protein SAMN05444514_110193 [Pseudomonas syringae]SFM17012.1 hypothetical protein SAMN05444064_110193 [Pseudomonas syringae]
MGSKIFKAEIQGVGQKTAQEYESSSLGTPICPSTGCVAKLTFVKSHNRQLADKTITVKASFRLKPKEVHAADCKYNLEGQLKVMAAGSDTDVFGSVSKNSYEFRLHILLQAFRDVSKLEASSTKDTEKNQGKDKLFFQKGKLSSYLKKLKQIVELRSLCEDNEELSSLIVIKNGTKSIPWSEFYFDHENIRKLVNVYGVPKTTPPLAICGSVKGIRSPTEKFPFHSVELDAPYIKPDANNEVVKPVVRVILKVSSLLSSFTVGEEYIFFGRWKTSQCEKGVLLEGGPSWVFQNINMYIENDDHFLKI